MKYADDQFFWQFTSADARYHIKATESERDLCVDTLKRIAKGGLTPEDVRREALRVLGLLNVRTDWDKP